MSCAVHLDYQGGTVLTAILLALGIGPAFGVVQGCLIAYRYSEMEKKLPCAAQSNTIKPPVR